MKTAIALQRSHAALKLGLVDSVVMAVAVRLRATAIVTLDAPFPRRLTQNPPAPRLIPLDG